MTIMNESCKADYEIKEFGCKNTYLMVLFI